MSTPPSPRISAGAKPTPSGGPSARCCFAVKTAHCSPTRERAARPRPGPRTARCGMSSSRSARRALVIDGAGFASALHQAGKLRRELLAARAPFALEVRRHLGFHDGLVPFPGLARGGKQLDLLNAIAERVDQFGECLFRVGLG